MKKILFVLLCLLFTGCSNNKNVDDNNVTISNPIIEVNSKEELEDIVGYSIPLLDKEVENFYVIKDIKHVRIYYKDDSVFEMAKGNDDISGIYGAILEKEEKINNINVKYYTYNIINYIIWTSNGYSYSYMDNKELNDNEVKELVR